MLWILICFMLNNNGNSSTFRVFTVVCADEICKLYCVKIFSQRTARHGKAFIINLTSVSLLCGLDLNTDVRVIYKSQSSCSAIIHTVGAFNYKDKARGCHGNLFRHAEKYLNSLFIIWRHTRVERNINYPTAWNLLFVAHMGSLTEFKNIIPAYIFIFNHIYVCCCKSENT